VTGGPGLFVTGAEVAGRGPVDAVLTGGRVTALGPRLAPPPGLRVVEAHGGALLPGLHDHHLHLLAAAAARRSVDVGPPAVTDRRQLAGALAGAAPGPDGWVRAVGYHDSVAGPLDRDVLDALVPEHPLRLQHRSGALWVLNSPGLARLGLADGSPPGAEPGVELASGRPTGRLFHLDAWLGARLPSAPPDLAAVGAALAACGVTGVTDATATATPASLDLLARAAADGRLPQRVLAMGPLGLEAPAPLALGPVKVALAEDALPGLDQLAATVEAAHDEGRAVAVHCVTVAQLVLTVTALRTAGARPGDRVEHGSLVPDGLVEVLAELGVTVVTQPGFVAARGDQYRAEVPTAEHQDLYRCASLLRAGVAVAGGSDAPFGPLDPWVAVRAAQDRRTPSGAMLGPDEVLGPEAALDLYLGPPGRPGAPVRTLQVGAVADCCLLAVPLAEMLRHPDAGAVRLTVVGGQPVFEG